MLKHEQGAGVLFFSPALIICFCGFKISSRYSLFIISQVFLSITPEKSWFVYLLCALCSLSENLKIKNGLSEISKKWLLLGIFWHIISERAPVRANICPTYVIHLISWLSVVLNLKKLKVNPDLFGLYWRVIQEQKWPFFADLSLRFAPDNSGLFSTVNLCQFESNQ